MARFKVSSTLLAGAIQEFFPWPEGTVIGAVDDDPEGIYAMEFSVESPGLAEDDEVLPTFMRTADGSVHFAGWGP